jgi:hypothetical protein
MWLASSTDSAKRTAQPRPSATHAASSPHWCNLWYVTESSPWRLVRRAIGPPRRDAVLDPRRLIEPSAKYSCSSRCAICAAAREHDPVEAFRPRLGGADPVAHRSRSRSMPARRNSGSVARRRLRISGPRRRSITRRPGSHRPPARRDCLNEGSQGCPLLYSRATGPSSGTRRGRSRALRIRSVSGQAASAARARKTPQLIAFRVRSRFRNKHADLRSAARRRAWL